MNARKKKGAQVQKVSRRDSLKLYSLLLGALALPRASAEAIDREFSPGFAPPVSQPWFQWQNEFLCKTIYPMREVKLRDFLNYYMEIDIWKQYRDKSPIALARDVNEYKQAWEASAAVSLQKYNSLRDYFLKEDASEAYSRFQPVDPAEMAEINNLHGLFGSWPRDIRGERSFVEGVIAYWLPHRDGILAWIRGRKRRHEAMDPAHPKYIPEAEELQFKENTTLPMAQQEMDTLLAFLATYDKLEERKLAWYRLSKSDPNFKTPEAEFLVQYPPGQPVTKRDLAHLKAEAFAKTIAAKNQYELLDLIRQRFKNEPGRFPPWLQYMVVHYSGMRYYSANGCWADPRDLLFRLQAPKIEEEIKALDDAVVERLCREKVAAYERPAGAPGSRPKLAGATEKEWREKIGWYLPNLKSDGPKTRRQGLIDMRKTEAAYEIWSRPIAEALAALRSMKGTFPGWAWKEIVKLTSLRVTEVSDQNWESLTPQEVEARSAQEGYSSRVIMDAWENHDLSAWREENGRTLDLIVTRMVCNETAETCQHARGQLPPGGLAAKPEWYAAQVREGKFPGAYYLRPTSAKDYTQGASILWLRFVEFSSTNPPEWQIAKPVQGQKVGLLPGGFSSGNGKGSGWVYTSGSVITRTRTTLTADHHTVVQNQWLRWIHEATVAEVGETADGTMVLCFETALPGGDRATSAVGLFKAPLEWHLSDGTEDQYNRSFVGYVPEGPLPLGQLKAMLDWKKIFRQ